MFNGYIVKTQARIIVLVCQVIYRIINTACVSPCNRILASKYNDLP